MSDKVGDLGDTAEAPDPTRVEIVKKLWLADDATGSELSDYRARIDLNFSLYQSTFEFAGGVPNGLGGSEEGMFGHYAINAYWPNTAIDDDNLRGVGQVK